MAQAKKKVTKKVVKQESEFTRSESKRMADIEKYLKSQGIVHFALSFTTDDGDTITNCIRNIRPQWAMRIANNLVKSAFSA